MWVKLDNVLVDIDSFDGFRYVFCIEWLFQGLHLGEWINLKSSSSKEDVEKLLNEVCDTFRTRAIKHCSEESLEWFIVTKGSENDDCSCCCK